MGGDRMESSHKQYLQNLSYELDMWAVGVIMVELVFNKREEVFGYELGQLCRKALVENGGFWTKKGIRAAMGEFSEADEKNFLTKKGISLLWGMLNPFPGKSLPQGANPKEWKGCRLSSADAHAMLGDGSNIFTKKGIDHLTQRAEESKRKREEERQEEIARNIQTSRRRLMQRLARLERR